MPAYFFKRLISPNDKTNKFSSSQIMLWVLIALVPGLYVQTRFFGFGNIIQIVIAVALALLFEGLFLACRKRSLSPLKDGSAIVTGVLLAMSIPSLAPWWIITIGVFFAIIVAKQLYGGLGHNIFNPAMIGYVVLLIAFPVQMTQWVYSPTLMNSQFGFFDAFQVIFEQHTDLLKEFDGITRATPLDKLKTTINAGATIQDALIGQKENLLNFAGVGWQQLNIAFLLGGVLLLMLRIIRWQIPIMFLVTLFICSAIQNAVSPNSAMPMMMQLFSGATMLGAFFILTDPVSASTTLRGQMIYGVMIGFFVWLIRTFGSYPDAVAFAVLFANLCVPLIDHYTKPRTYGH